MRVTICELRNEPDDLARDWEQLVAHVRAEASDLVLLAETKGYMRAYRTQWHEYVL